MGINRLLNPIVTHEAYRINPDISSPSSHFSAIHRCRYLRIGGAKKAIATVCQNGDGGRRFEARQEKSPVPTTFGTFFGNYNHCFWRKKDESWPSWRDLHAFKLWFHIWSTFVEVGIWTRWSLECSLTSMKKRAKISEKKNNRSGFGHFVLDGSKTSLIQTCWE